ncbi:hypothetical protein O4328_43020 [Rhodococcus opacus]|uniref:Uncharacterized protein n=1 Tax=Rhodococcus opacus TaxID=37919 RepID=A0AAX3YW71_RHOOP|nr:hypothetical protein [Rhodococcus opacus]MCZ4590316.1 hypothetical protein [Rhodococcus opacus]WLF51576.1 hypothetical protein Q5707_39345 [Rhodococcus opacus]WLF52627.1 hypothetical protein Q5707_45650 [Rhodococcus opacus]
MPGEGRVAVDDTSLTWMTADAARLQVICRLRAHGFSEIMLRDGNPAYPVLRRVAADQWPQVFADWNHLVAWRHADLWWQIGLRANRGDDADTSLKYLHE